MRYIVIAQYNGFPLAVHKYLIMPKVEIIISECQKQCPNSLPDITQVFESDPDRVSEALKERGRDFQFYAMLRILQSECLRRLKRQFLKPLLEINVADLSNLEFKNEARLRICEGIIAAEDLYRTNTIDRHLIDMTDFQRMTNAHRARIEIVNAGNNFLKGEYIKASAQYLAATRMQAFVKDEQHKIELISKAIAFIFVADIGPEEHKVVCSLCLNETAKRSKLYGLVTKMYRQDIINGEEVRAIEQLLPKVLAVRDNEGISRINQATFSRNMIPIVNSFSSIRFNTLLNLIGLASIAQLLILLEKTYQNGEISIDQVEEVIYIAGNISTSEMVKDFLTQIDNVLQQ